MKLVELLLGASLVVGASGCPCPDGHSDGEVQVMRAQFASQVDRCLASDSDCEALCRAVFGLDPSATVEKCVITALDDKTAHVETTFYDQVECVGGRRPNGFVAPRCRSRVAAEWLAQIATVEAASITSFARLVRALEKHGAPERFVEAAKSALLDEIVHARLTAQLAWSMGATVEAPVIGAHEPLIEGSPRALEELARENAVEGQVAETFGALLAACQGQLATDPDVRRVFALIAVDEAKHAMLAHELAPWFDSQLDAETRAEIARARRDAVAAIGNFDMHLGAEDRALLGIPDLAKLRAAFASIMT